MSTLGTSTALGVCCLAPNLAWAQCAPNPTQAYGTTTCTGTDPNTLVANTNGSTVTIQSGASVASVYATTLVVPGGYYQPTNSITIADNGQITGGLTVDSGALIQGSYNQTGTSVDLTVGANASIGGATAISLVAETASYGNGTAYLSLDNSGSIQSNSGAAIVGNGNGNALIGHLTNEAGGSIGAIQAVVSNLTNSGTISGGAASAIDTTSTTSSYYNELIWQNSGSITSSGSAPTINAATNEGSVTILNSGQITNGGSGVAINVPQSGDVYSTSIGNSAGATISSTGSTAIVVGGAATIFNSGTISGNGYAIQTAAQLDLTSTGTINGSVAAGNPYGYAASVVNLSNGGSINGSLSLAGSLSAYSGNTLIVDYADGANPLSSISGTVTIGGSNNALILNLPGTTTLSDPIALPAEFSSLGLQLNPGSTVTLGSGFTTPVGLTITSTAIEGSSPITFVNAANISTTGAALTQAYSYSAVSIVNTGTITANMAGSNVSAYAVTADLSSGTALTNSGAITATGGNGVSIFGSASNSGTITADAMAVSVDGLFTNSGTISGGSTGLGLLGSATNTGTISGGQIGVAVGEGTLTNSGTITSSGGTAVELQGYATFYNLQGGVINGAIGGIYSGSVIRNAGTINGNVNLNSNGYIGYPSGNTYIALAGGVLNGNLNLGSGGDTLLLGLGSTGPGTYAGITGTVTGSGTETLAWLVTADSTTTLNAPTGVFSVVGYDLANNANLTLTSTGTQGGSYQFAGTGTVNLTANISGTGASSLLNLSVGSVQLDNSTAPVPTVLNFTSNANLTVMAGNPNLTPATGVIVGSGSTFTNNGTIIYNSIFSPSYAIYQPADTAIADGGTVINNGTIELAGSAGIIGTTPYYETLSTSVVNTGSIVQIAGGSNAVGMIGVESITNSGTIATGGPAIEFEQYYPNTLVNSGTISSANTVAITTDPASYNLATAQIINQASGVISGGTDRAAIALGAGSAIINSGTINGDVKFFSQATYGGSTYIADGGTLNGNLVFFGSNNTLVVIGASSGITGTINTVAASNNLYAQGFTASATVDPSTVALPSGFQTYGMGAIGSGTVVTIAGPSAGLNSGFTVFGNGTVINTATVNSGAYGGNSVTLSSTLNTLLGETGGITFVNAGTLSDGVQGTAQSFTNSGTIGTQQNSVGANLTLATAPTFTFGNSGQVWGTVFLNQSIPSSSSPMADSVTILNSGNISGGLDGTLTANQLTFTNSGVVNTVELQSDQSSGITADPSSQGTFTVTNTASGVVIDGYVINAASHDIVFNNAGQIGAELGLGQTASGTADDASASITNSGVISGRVALSLNSTSVSFVNSGTIASTSGYEYQYGYGGLQLYNSTVGNGTVAFTNSGTILSSVSGQSAMLIYDMAGSTNAPATAAIAVTNTGSIAAYGGGIYYTPFGTQFVAAGLAVNAYAGGGSASIAITNAAGASIAAYGLNNSAYYYYNSGPVPSGLVNAGSVALIALAQTINVANAGTITGGGDTNLAGTNLALQVNGLSLPSAMTALAGAIDLVGTTVSLTNASTGTINGNTLLYSDAATFANYGTVNGNVTLGSGDGTGTATAIEGINATLNGTVTGLAATNNLEIDVTGGGVFTQALLTQLASPFIGFGAPSLTGSGTIGFDGPLSVSTLVLNNASLTLAAGQVLQTSGPIAITGGSGTNSFTNYGTVNGAIVDVATTNGGVINIATTATSDATFTNLAGGQLNLNSGTFTIDGLVTNGGTVTVAQGATLDAPGGIANAQGGVIQVDGTVNDALVNAGTVIVNGAYNADIVNLAGGSFTASGAVTAPDSIQNAGTFTGNGATVSAPTFANLAGGVLAGTVAFNTPGGTLLTNQGTISGAVTFGAGANELLLGSGSVISGSVTGGSGSNLLAIQSSASDAAPDQFTLTGVTGFQKSQLLAGSVALSGSYTTGSFDVLGGHLIGNAGSVLNVGTLTVASGAAFGSAGTVNGNVAFNSGSTAVLASGAKLNVIGKISIASGSTLTVGGTLPTRQGSLVQLASASGGISGAFSATNLPTSVDLIETGNLLEIYRPFVAGAGFGSGAANALGAVNSLVVSGRADPALIAGLATLDNAQGTADAGKFARLTPEPYATATQIGVDNGLQIAETLRDFDYNTVAGPVSDGGRPFTFAEALGNWTHAGGNLATGSSTATNASGGILGGVGWRGASWLISAFAGGMHDQQTISALGATTSAHSSLFGGNALAWFKGVDLAATVAWNNGTGDTTRVLPDTTSTRSHYGLRAMVSDIALGYTIGDRSGWTMRPELGFTHIVTHRDEADEVGSTAFGLDVAGERRRLDFVDGSWRIAPPTAATGKFAPWASMGFRVRVNSDNPVALGFLPEAGDPIAAAGVLSARTEVTFKGGFSYALTPAASFYASFDGARGSGGHNEGVHGGVRFSF